MTNPCNAASIYVTHVYKKKTRCGNGRACTTFFFTDMPNERKVYVRTPPEQKQGGNAASPDAYNNRLNVVCRAKILIVLQCSAASIALHRASLQWHIHLGSALTSWTVSLGSGMNQEIGLTPGLGCRHDNEEIAGVTRAVH